MKQLEWPGIGTAAALICTVTIVIAIWRDPDGFRLKDWQPLMAACIALVGGVMAYRGAMAKVELDRNNMSQDRERMRLRVYMRLDASLETISDYLHDAAEAIRELPNGKHEFITTDTIPSTLASSIQDAWENLDLFPQHLAKDIYGLRAYLDSLQRNIDRFPSAKLYRDEKDSELRVRLKQLPSICDSAREACDAIIAWLRNEISLRL